MGTIHPSLIDRAKEILTSANIPAEQKANAWDAYHDAPNSKHLVARLQYLDLPEEIKQQLYDAKRANEPEPTALDRKVEAIKRMATIPKHVLEDAEKHPVLLKALLDAANQTDK